MQYTENPDWTCGKVTREYCEEQKCPYLRYNSMTDYPICTKNYPVAEERVNFIDVLTNYAKETNADFLAEINGTLTPMYFNKD